MRGNIFRIGHVEGELLFRLTTYADLETAVDKFFTDTAFRPSMDEVASFILMLQRESLALLPDEEVIRRESHADDPADPGFLQKFVQTPIFLRIPLLRPDGFLGKTRPWISFLWSPFFRWMYVFCGVLGLIMTLQEIELYVGTVNYLFTPQGGLAFFLCLAALKIGHEFAHGYAAKDLGLHVRSMGILFIVFWPLLYTDTTDAWKIPDRRKRMWVSIAGVLFELAVGGIALLLWALLPDGIPRSLMFFLSGTSLVTSIFINLNPFMRYDGYYLLMDLWGVDNLRARAFSLLRYNALRFFFGWKGLSPEIHPHRRSLAVYGFLAVCYRLVIAFSIAAAVYYLVFPELGLILLLLELWFFIFRPVFSELRNVFRHRARIGSKFRTALTMAGLFALFFLFAVPLPRYEQLPCLLMHRDAVKVEAPAAGRLATRPPEEGIKVSSDNPVARLENDGLLHETANTKFDLAAVREAIKNIGTGGEAGAYRRWLLAEEKRLIAAAAKMEEAVALLEIRMDGLVVDVNDELYEKAFVGKGTYLFTIAGSDGYELKAYVHEKLVGKTDRFATGEVEVRFAAPEAPVLKAKLREKSLFPTNKLPNDSLLDFAGGPISSIADSHGKRPRDAWFPFTFDIRDAPGDLPHGLPAWIWMRIENRSFAGRILAEIKKSLMERGLF